MEKTQSHSTVGIDHLSLTVWGESWETIMPAIERHLGVSLTDFEPSRSGSRTVERTPHNLRVTHDEGSSYHWISIPGSVASAVGPAALAAFACEFPEHRASRVDIALDVHGEAPSPEDLERQFLENRAAIRTRSRVVTLHRESRDGERVGSTCAMGSRASETYVRAYDKRGFLRVEAEFKGDRAAHIWNNAVGVALGDLKPENGMAGFLVSWVRRAVDFLDPTDGTLNRSRARLAAWWASAVRLAAVAASRIPSPARTFARALDWIALAVAPTLRGLQTYGFSRAVADAVRDADVPSWMVKVANAPPATFAGGSAS